MDQVRRSPRLESRQLRSDVSSEPETRQPETDGSKLTSGNVHAGEDKSIAQDTIQTDEDKLRTSGLVIAEAPRFFEGRETVTYAEFLEELRKLADEFSEHPNVKAAHQQLLADAGLTEAELPLESFSRARLVFESGRDSGLWGIRGTVTDQMPWSDRIWEQWAGLDFEAQTFAASDKQSTRPTAYAECDELAALFAFIVRDLGVVGFVALHWPVWNHVVPVWQVKKADGSIVRIVVPATQTFLTSDATMGTKQIETRRVVFPYSRKDRKPWSRLSGELARYLLRQSSTFGALSTQEFSQRRLRQRRRTRKGK